MPTVCFTLSGADLVRLVTAICTRFGYSATLPNGDPNPQTPQEFTRLRIAQWARHETIAHELATAQAAVAAPTDIAVG